VLTQPIFRSLSAQDRPKAGRRRAFLRRLLGDRSGIAAFEFAAAAPVLIVTFGGVTDLGIAIWDHMTTAAAVNAGADYAVAQAQNPGVSSSGVAGYLSNVAAVVAGASRGGATLSTSNITVTYNNAASNANFGACYCVPSTGVFPSASSNCGSVCPDGSVAGQFVQIQATYNYSPLSPVDTPFLSGSYTDTVTVMVTAQ
jgi:Flp pilus assembly protein TadG